jgi:hypothetical protein
LSLVVHFFFQEDVMNRSTLVHFAAAVAVTGFAWTGARAADDTCRSGYVWREAFPGDRVCVTPPTRDQAAQDNAQAGARRQAGGAYGPDTCRSGYVWREAGANDRVCVTPPTRDEAAKDNAQAAARRVASQAPAAAQPAASYRVSDWSGWSRAAGIEYRYRWGWNPQDSRYATRVDAIFQMRNRQSQAWEGSARSLDCEKNAVSMGTRVVLQANETKEVGFLTPNCGSRTNPSFQPNVVKSVRID